ncbi:MAG TPA: hypothetical protein VHO69_16605 [Phototrophicaceae bacterium]|nr:hypothetical protein [Phototrophicaceae bacterium]
MTQSSSPASLPLTLGLWLIRLLLALLLLVGSEILVWTNPPGRELLDWPLMLLAYTVVAALLLDILVRYRVRDLFGAMLLAGLYSLTASLTLNPESLLADMPRTLITRIMGIHGFMALEMIGLFLVLTGGQPSRRTNRLLLVSSLIVGLAWGIWGRWFPADNQYPEIALPALLVYGAVSAGLIGGVLALLPARTGGLTPDHLRLSRGEWGGLFLALLALLALRWLQLVIPIGAALMVLPVLILCWVILWFRGRATGKTLLDLHLPVAPPAWGHLTRALVVFLVAASVSYNLPLLQVGDFNQFTLIGVGFTAYGLAWLPTVSLVLGAQAYLRQLQVRQG